MRDLLRSVGNLLEWLGAIVAAALPKRWWPVLDAYLPASESTLASAIVTVLAAGAIGIPGFVNYTSEQASLNNRATLAAAQRQAAKPESQERFNERDWGRAIVGASSLSLFTFVLLTPAGWLSTYLGVSGTWRAIAAAVDEPFGDPILTALDALIVGGTLRARERRMRLRREALEGPDVPDRIVPASRVGVAGADLVVVCARRKPQWDMGTAVDTGDRWFRVTSIEERTIGGRLRTLYGLREHKDLEVFRRCVRYDLPSAK
jgi:hypothetical protein